MRKTLFLVAILWILAGIFYADAAGLLPSGSTPPATLYTVVNVSPGTGTIAAAISAHGANHTYILANGTYTENNISVPNNVQFIGSGASNVTVRAAASGDHVFKGGGGADLVTIWGMTIDLDGGTGNALGDNFSDLLFQNVHVQNYASTALHFEDFPIYLFATGYSPNNVTIDHCQFTQAASGSVDGTSVIATGAYRQADGGNPAANYTNLTISNNLFDTPTDTGSAYYHCVGSAQTCFGNVFVAPSFSNGQFWYEEAGSWNGNPNGIFQSNASNTSTLTGNTVTLAPNWDFAGVVTHTLGANENLVIIGNAIHGNSSSGSVVATHGGQGCPSSGFAITSAIIQNNAINTGTNLVSQACTNGSPWTTSPNNGASTPSSDDTVVTTVGPTITDLGGNVWAITSGAKVSLNGSTTATSYTSGVVEIAYVSLVVWQYNGTNWYSFNSDGSLALGPTTTSPLPGIPSTPGTLSTVGFSTPNTPSTLTTVP